MDNHELSENAVSEDKLEKIKGVGVGKGEIEYRMILQQVKRFCLVLKAVTRAS